MSQVVELIEDAVEFIGDVAEWVVDEVIDAVEWLWDEIVEPAVEWILGLVGIEDETILHVQKISTLVYEDNPEDVVQRNNEKAILSMINLGGSFFEWYRAHHGATKAQLTAYYRHGANGHYVYGLPTMEIYSGDVDITAVDTALETEIGVPCTILSIHAQSPPDAIYIKWKMQLSEGSPYSYQPYNNRLTFTDPWNISRTDYVVDAIFYNLTTNRWQVNISREAVETLFWIEGPDSIVEGDSATYKIKCNRAIPAGCTARVNFNFSGTMLSRRYQAVSFVTFAAGQTEVDLVISTDENSVSDGNVTIIIDIESVEKTGADIEAIGIYAPKNSITTNVIDDEGLILTMSSQTTAEGVSAVIPVKLENAPPGGAFTVDYALDDGTAIGGVDFTDSPVTLNFAGTAGEVQNISVPILTDAPDDEEYFTVRLTACSDATIDISNTAKVTIIDGSSTAPLPDTVTLSGKITFPPYTPEYSLVVKYYKDSESANEWYYWIYPFSSEAYPLIESNANAISNLEMLPIGIIKQDGVNVNADKGSKVYSSTTSLLKIIDINLDEITESLEQNPDYNVVEDVYVNFAVSAEQTVEIVSKILWLSFYNTIVENNLTTTETEFVAKFTEQDVNNAVAWKSNSHTAGLSGTITGGKTYHHEYELIPEIVDGEGVVTQEATSWLTIQYQTAPGIYSEIQVQGLSGVSIIDKQGMWSLANYKLGDTELTIPLSQYILNQLTDQEIAQGYQHMFRIDAYAAQIVELEYYETAGFANLFQIVGLVISVWTFGAGTTIFEVFKQILIVFLVSQIVIYLAELTGNAVFAALVGLVAMIVIGGKFDIAFDFSNAEDLLLACTNFADNITLASDVIMDDIQEEMDILQTKAEQRIDEIMEAGENLKSSSITTEFMAALTSVDKQLYPARDAQYNFDLLFNYDRLISDYYNIHLQKGVV